MSYDEFCEKVFDLMPKYLLGTEFQHARVRLTVHADWEGTYTADISIELEDGHVKSLDLYPFYQECGLFGCDDHTLGHILEQFRSM